jgi:predicted MPP superfamily phosphohydrolase
VSRLLVFLAVSIALLGGIHTYIWARLVRATGLPEPWRIGLTIALAVLALSVPATFVLRRATGALPAVVYRAAMVWLGLAFLLLIALVTVDVVRLGAFVAGRIGGGPRVADPERRLFFARLAGGVAAMAAAAAAGVGLVEAARVRVKEVRVPLARLPEALDGTTIAQITDIHIGPTLGREFLEGVVAEINALAPDVVAITGDLVDGSPEELAAAVEPLGRLRAKHGVYFVTGNHEYYAGVEPWLEVLARLGVRVLRNERVSIGAGDASFDLAGVDDYSSAGMAPGHGPDLERALAGRDPTRELVLLAHQPRAVRQAAELGVGLQLSGHTHGGQIWPWRYLVYLQQPFVSGLDRVRDTWIYVSCGTGFWGPPYRLGAPPEISKVVLRRAARA